MIQKYIKRLIAGNREFILRKVLEVKGLMRLLMKRRNTGLPWTKEEKRELKRYLGGISKAVPLMAVFFLPGGSLLFPILAEVLDRRMQSRYNCNHAPETYRRDRGTED